MAKIYTKKIVFFGFITTLLGSVLLIVSISLYWNAGQTLYPWTNYISDLSVGPNGSNYIYFAMLGVIGMFTLFFFHNARKYLDEISDTPGMTKAGFISAIFFLIAMILLIIFPLDETQSVLYNIHVVSAIITFLSLGMAIILFVIAFRVTGEINSLSTTVGSLGGLLSIIVSVLFFCVEIMHLFEPGAIYYLIEWITMVLYFMWMILIGMTVNRTGMM